MKKLYKGYILVLGKKNPTYVAFCKFGLVRSLLSKCIEPHETGKIFSALAIVCALMPTIANPVFRQLYNCFHMFGY